jgi:DnaK suppressor protein
MNAAIAYPLDYQLALARTIDIRLDAARRAGHAEEITGLAAALGRLRSGEIGACASCGATIPYQRLAADPTIERCLSCSG